MSRPKTFRWLRKKVAQDSLISKGFFENGAIYSIQRDQQYQCLDFQTSNFGKTYYVNIGFTYCWMPALFSYTAQPIRKYSIYDFLFISRLQHQAADSVTEDSSYQAETEEEVAAVQSQLKKNIDDSMEILDEVCREYRDPSTFLEMYAPGNPPQGSNLLPTSSQFPTLKWRTTSIQVYTTC